MQNYRNNPESEENARMTRDNQRAVFAAQMEAEASRRWEVKFHLENKDGETQSIGYKWFDHKPADEDIDDLRENLLAANIWATNVRIEITVSPSQASPPPR